MRTPVWSKKSNAPCRSDLSLLAIPAVDLEIRGQDTDLGGFISSHRYLIHDRDGKFCAAFVDTIESVSVKTVKLPAKSPNLNAFAERWVRLVKGECLSKLILFGEASLRRALAQYVDHHHRERPHQGKGNVILFPSGTDDVSGGSVRCRERLGGLLKLYYREAG